jgi:hypothetical protein
MKIKFKLDGKWVSWGTSYPLLTPGENNMKLNKSEKLGVYSTMGLHLAPANLSGYNVCPMASPGCKAGCLNYSGCGQKFREGQRYNAPIHISRIGRTLLLKKNKPLFFKKLKHEIDLFLKRCEKRGTKPCMRLNCTSDLAWEKILDPNTGKNIMDLYPMIQFYDYTKIFNRLGKTPKNYFLNFSRSECNEEQAIQALEMGINVTVVFLKADFPENYKGYKIINGDLHDLRFLDSIEHENKTNKGMVIGLKTKGWRAWKDTSGFVIRPAHWNEITYTTKAVA